ncbi:MAG: serine/threonine-protein phosphatase [Bacteroidales bacterium]|nr:serine/threonine-protein phosphatase [Bacteroidales bacterium]
MKKIIVYILFVLSAVSNIKAQTNTEIQQLLEKYLSASTDYEKMDYSFKIATCCENIDTVMLFSQRALYYAQNLKDSTIWAQCYGYMAWAYYYKNEFETSMKFLQKELDMAKRIGDKKILAKALLHTANNCNVLNRQSEAVKYYKQAIKIYLELEDSIKVAEIYRQMGDNSKDLYLYGVAFNNYKSAISIDVVASNNIGLAYDYACLAELLVSNFEENYENQDFREVETAKRYADSVPILLKDYHADGELSKIINGRYNKAATMINLLFYKRSLKEHKNPNTQYLRDAEKFMKAFRAYADELRFLENRRIAEVFEMEILLLKGETYRAVTKAEHLKANIGGSLSLGTSAMIYKVSSDIYAFLGDYTKAYEDSKNYILIRNKFANQKSLLVTADFRSDLKTEEAIDRVMVENEKEAALQNEKLRFQQTVIFLVGFIVFCLVVAMFFIIKALKLKKESVTLLNEKNQRLSQQQQELLSLQSVITEQRTTVEKANIEMYQSINYAKHIQQAVMSSPEDVKNVFPDSFVYYLPKDIVSGDFYYVTRNSGYDIMVIADCTGHGVPGGFLSMLGLSAIKELLKNPEIDIAPGIILDMMRDYIKSALSNDEIYLDSISNDIDDESFSTADGMDMSICALDQDNYKLRFAGAYQSAYIVRDGEVIRLKGDRMPVGRHINERPNFTTQYLDVQKGDMIYMQSDGIESQIGYTGTKFMTKRLKEFFINNYKRPCQEQRDTIAQILEDWMFGAIQVDDLSLAGIRVG